MPIKAGKTPKVVGMSGLADIEQTRMGRLQHVNKPAIQHANEYAKKIGRRTHLQAPSILKIKG